MAHSINAKCEHGKKFESLLRIKCGTVPIASSRIVRGMETERGQWLEPNLFLRKFIYFWTCFRPFLVALLVERTQSFFCSGNLITSKHVLTAAHCVQDKGQTIPLEASDIILLVGRHNISMRAERGSTTREVSEILLHPDWDHTSIKFDADVAILVMTTAVTFSHVIQPVCLIRGAGNLGISVGTVVSRFASN